MVFATLVAAATPGLLAGEAAALSRLLRVRAQRPTPRQSSPWRPRRGFGHVTCRHHPGVQQEPKIFAPSFRSADAVREPGIHEHGPRMTWKSRYSWIPEPALRRYYVASAT